MNWLEVIQNKYLNYTLFVSFAILSCYIIIVQYNKQTIVSNIEKNIVHIATSKNATHIPKQLSPMLLHSTLFGTPIVTTQKKPEITHVIRLIGIVQTNNGASTNSAIISVDTNTTKILSPGESIAPGIILSKIEPKHIIINNNGTLMPISLPEFI